MRMSNAGRNGSKLSIHYKVGKGGEIPWASIKLNGWAAPIIERPTKPHAIYARGTSGGRGRKKKFNSEIGPFALQGPLATGPKRGNMIMPPARGFRKSAFHPGTDGKYPFAKGQEAAEVAVLKIMKKRTFQVIKAAAGAG